MCRKEYYLEGGRKAILAPFASRNGTGLDGSLYRSLYVASHGHLPAVFDGVTAYVTAISKHPFLELRFKQSAPEE